MSIGLECGFSREILQVGDYLYSSLRVFDSCLLLAICQEYVTTVPIPVDAMSAMTAINVLVVSI